jgi:PTS system mannose-specific IIC component
MVAIVAGLDRTALVQCMVCRPIVAAPLTGWLLGTPATGLLVGLLVELLWLGRLPVGAAIPPDDTQVAIGGTTLAVSMGPSLQLDGPGFIILCTLVALPLGKIGQLFERVARHRNDRLVARAEIALAGARLKEVEYGHLLGLGHFALASGATFGVILAGGSLCLQVLAPVLGDLCVRAAVPLQLVLPLVGIGVLLGTINVNRSLTLFGSSFASVCLMLWLL